MSAEHPFADLISLQHAEQRSGYSVNTLQVEPKHLNPNGVVHGAVLFAMADTSMGGALLPTVSAGELCVTIEIKISYFKPVRAGLLRCVTELVNRARSVAHLESSVFLDELLVARASGTYAIVRPSAAPPAGSTPA